MSKESKQLAKNTLDEKETPTIVILLSLFGFAFFLIAMLGLFTGTIKISLDAPGLVTIDKQILIPKPIVTVKTEPAKPQVMDGIIQGMTTPIDETQENTMRTILEEEQANKTLILHPSASDYCFPEEGETIASLIKEYSSCRRYTNTEVDGDQYEIVSYFSDTKCPSVKPFARKQMLDTGMITWIDWIKIEEMCQLDIAQQEKTKMLEKAKNMKEKLLDE